MKLKHCFAHSTLVFTPLTPSTPSLLIDYSLFTFNYSLKYACKGLK